MKTEAEVDAIMREIPEKWRARWCGGERGPCACLGCVQIGNRAVIYKRITGQECKGDPEHLSESELRKHAQYEDLKITRAEWEAWNEHKL